MKTKIALILFLLSTALSASAQMDDKFYPGDKQWRAIDSVNYEIIDLKVDKDTIYSILVKPDVPVKATIVYFHGNGANASKWIGHFKPLIKEGFQVCLLDYRGYGKSTGTPTHQNIASDAQLLFYTLLQREDVKNARIIIYGASIGTQVATLIARKNNARICALVVDGMMASFTDVALAVAPPASHNDIKAHIISPYSARENFLYISGIKVLFIHSQEDFIPIDQAKKVYNDVSCEKRFWEYEGAHVMAPIEYPDTFLKHINWLIADIQ